MRGDYYHQITAELARHGIKPEVGLTKGNHVRFRWTVNNRNQTLVTAGTPGDARASKNALARVRRMLRDAGVEKTSLAPPKPHAAPAAAAAPTIEQRIARLEHDMQMLMGLMHTISGRIDAAIAAEPVPEPIAEPAPKAVPEPAPKKTRGRPWTNPEFLWRVMRYDEFLGVTAIADACGKGAGYTSVLLGKLKKRGLVQHQPYVGWRKDRKVEQLNGHA